MSTVMNAVYYRKLLMDDMAWLDGQPRTLEREHIRLILQWQHRNAERVTAEDREKQRTESQP